MPDPLFIATGTRHYAPEKPLARTPRRAPAFVPAVGQRVRIDCAPPVTGTVRAVDAHREKATVQIGARLVPFWWTELREVKD